MPRKLNEQKFCGWCGSEVVYKSEWMSECRACGYKNYINPKPCCGVMITQGSKVLMNQRSIDPGKGKLDLPGGFMDITDDSLEGSAYRELAEELGLKQSDLTLLAYIGSRVQPYDWNNSELFCACSYFVCQLKTDPSNIVVDQSENSQIHWVGKDDLKDIDFAFGIDKEMLTKYFEENVT